MRFRRSWTLALGLAVLGSACTADDGADDSSVDDGSGTADDEASTGDATTADTTSDATDATSDATDTTSDTTTTDTTDSGGVIEFAAVHQILMDQGCTAGYCHGAGQGGLTMTDAPTAYMNLVDVDATMAVCGLQKRVVPGDAESSIMWRRVRPIALDMGMACANKMPQGTDGLPDAEAQVVFDWIQAGALP